MSRVSDEVAAVERGYLSGERDRIAGWCGTKSRSETEMESDVVWREEGAG